MFDGATISMANIKFLTTPGARIKELRFSKEMTQNNLANHCDFKPAYQGLNLEKLILRYSLLTASSKPWILI